MSTISDLFFLDYGHSLELNKLTQSDAVNAINFVSRTTRNNGVSARVEPVSGEQPALAGTLSVALGGQGGAGETFVQPFPYYCGRDVMILTPKREMSDTEKLWWATCITANRFRYGFGRQANRTLKDIILPDPASIPSWVFHASLDRFTGGDKPADPQLVTLSDTSSWVAYTLSDLFDIDKGKRLTKADMVHGSIPFIGAIDKNNGVSASVDTAIHKANTITVNYNGSVAEAFYQPEPFWCSDDVNVLYPKFPLNPAVALFIATVIRMERYRFNYGRKWHLERMSSSIIRLPAKPDGTPDWEYMEKYIKSLPFSSQIGQTTT